MDIAALSLVVAAIFVWGIISTRQAVISTPNLLRRRRPHPGRGPQAGRPPARSPCDEGHSRGHACLGAIRRHQPRTILRPARRSALLMESPRLSSRSHLLQSPPSRSWPRRASAWLDRFGLGRTDGRGAGCIRWHAAAFYWSAWLGFGRVRAPIRAGTRTSPWAHGPALPAS